MTTYSRFRPVRRRRQLPTTLLISLAVLVLLGLIWGGVSVYKGTEHNVTFTVQDKDRVCSGSNSGNSSCKYLIFTDRGTYKVTDSVLIGRFSSSDVYGRIRRDHTYAARVIGWRLPVFSEYPNIVSIQEQPR